MKKTDLEFELYKDLFNCFKKVKLNKYKNVYVTSDLKQISNIRLHKQNKLNLVTKAIKNAIGKNYTIFSPASSFNIINKDEIFDLKKTKTFGMGPLAEYLRIQKNSRRSLHPFWSISAIGKNSNILDNVSNHSYAYGSPWSKMLDLDTLQLNIGIKPSRAVTLIHHIETICGVPYRFNKKFTYKIKRFKKVYEDEFYLSVFYKNKLIKKRINLNEHFFQKLSKQKKTFYIKSKFGLEIWSFKMRDFFDIATEFFIKDIYNYLEFKPNLDFQKKM